MLLENCQYEYKQMITVIESYVERKQSWVKLDKEEDNLQEDKS